MLRVNELFAGIGAFRKALIRTGIPHEVVGISEIDKYAIKSYEAIYGETRNYGDISKVSKLDYADLWTYGFPCQDISSAGLQKGIVKGETRSGLLFEVQRLLGVAALYDELPKYLIMENVKNLVQKKFIGDFQGWLDWLDGIGYNNYWQVLNAADYGIPQSRERVFCISIRKDIANTFKMPSPIELHLTLNDLLEPMEDVEDKYYLSNKNVKFAEEKTARNIENGIGFKFQPVEREGESSVEQDNNDQRRVERLQQLRQGVVVKKQGKLIDRTTNIALTLMARDYKGFGNQGMTGVIEYGEVTKMITKRCRQVATLTNCKFQHRSRIYDTFALSPTLTTCGDVKIMTDKPRIRKLTPLECWRLMGFDDSDFKVAKEVNSNTQLYKQAGNSIVVNVLEAILGNLLVEERSDWLDNLLD